MRIELAGYNVEVGILERLDAADKDILTPEIFSSAYARISRSAEDITTLRKIAGHDVKKARASNRTIIFGMGHHSVAEHAVFNFDIIGVSRLALEEIESFRLASYTEKSQRYVTLKGDYVQPREITGPGTKDAFSALIGIQNDFYKKAYAILQEYNFKKFPGILEQKGGRRELQNLAKEDARYILSLATEGQVGMTINARSLEHLFRRFFLSKRTEVREIGRKMYDLVYKIAPSIFLFAQPSQFEKDLHETFKNNFSIEVPHNTSLTPKRMKLSKAPLAWGGDKPLRGRVCGAKWLGAPHPRRRQVAGKGENKQKFLSNETKIIDYPKNADDIILASFFAIYNSLDFAEAYEIAANIDAAGKKRIFLDLFKNMEFFDTPPRQFELPDITFQAVISASNFAQLKRHRIATLIAGDYKIELGNIIPESIRDCGLEGEFREIIEKTDALYLKLKEEYNEAADYVLTNSHCRMVIMKMNLREVYHFIRLRDDVHTQWEIRHLAGEILAKLREIMPYSTMLLCGKSNFVQEYENIYRKGVGPI
ncbi:MAG: FAD-dependent thymidylate synthase [Candidatus Aminicenantes bacterium]|nr:FAD-dependent thymidylate synthase [Candidatus Aminicenantes bacterium]